MRRPNRPLQQPRTCTLLRVSLPDEVQTVGELRNHLAEVMTQVRKPGARPVFVGRHRRREAVLMSAERYQQLLAAERRAAADDALGSVCAEGLEPTPFGLETVDQVVSGTLTAKEAIELLVVHHQQ